MAQIEPPPRTTVRTFVMHEWRELVTIHKSDRPWEFPFAVAVAAGLPMMVGAAIGDMASASLASLGAMTIVYLPRTRLSHRMATVAAIAVAMIACFGLGQISRVMPVALAPVLALVAIGVTMACRYSRVGPPGPLFLVMAAAIGAYAPGDLHAIWSRLAAFGLGACGAVGVALFYNLYIFRVRRVSPAAPPRPPEHFLETVVIEPLIIGLFVGLSLAVAQLLGLAKPYWAPVSCLAVIQGVSFRAIWNRQTHRIIGTVIGLGATWLLLRFAVDPWAIAIAVTVLTFCIETAIVRHYAFAAIFIAPLTILLAEAPGLGQVSTAALIHARLADTVVGALTGLAGGACIHTRLLRGLLTQWAGRPAARR